MPTPLSAFVQRIRRERRLPAQQVPDFDPKNGNERAKFLFILEAPGPKALESGYISLTNYDSTAANLRAQIETAGIKPSDIALWNVVPWYLGNKTRTRIRAAKSTDVKLGLDYLTAVIRKMPALKCIVLVGSAARKAHVHLSHFTTARILSCHHTSPRVHNTNPEAANENTAVFRWMLKLAQL